MLFCHQEVVIPDDMLYMKQKFLPLGIKNRTRTELPALIALEAIGQPWFSESHRFDLLSIALIAQMIAEEGSDVHTAAVSLNAALDAGNLQIYTIRPLVIAINEWMQRQPNGRIQGAIDKLLRWEARKVPQLACA
jgi:hypothetical protein